ncbi:MAG: hypothetical protein KDE54_38340, partial [Caldilineaceae bacterium]|nr:hypothetical protein [Caldilineaceae bacterium]
MRLMEQIPNLNFPAPLPKSLFVVDQRFDAPKIDDIPSATRQAVDKLAARMKPGATVAVGVGSRGIANLPIIVKA